MYEIIVENVIAALQLGACDVRDDSDPVNDDHFGLLAHENVAVEYELGTNCFDGSLEIDCRLRVMTPDGPGPYGNTWVLKPEFFLLWDRLPETCWATDTTPPLVQITGHIAGEAVTVNLNPSTYKKETTLEDDEANN